MGTKRAQCYWLSGAAGCGLLGRLEEKVSGVLPHIQGRGAETWAAGAGRRHEGAGSWWKFLSGYLWILSDLQKHNQGLNMG